MHNISLLWYSLLGMIAFLPAIILFTIYMVVCEHDFEILIRWLKEIENSKKNRYLTTVPEGIVRLAKNWLHRHSITWIAYEIITIIMGVLVFFIYREVITSKKLLDSLIAANIPWALTLAITEFIVLGCYTIIWLIQGRLINRIKKAFS